MSPMGVPELRISPLTYIQVFQAVPMLLDHLPGQFRSGPLRRLISAPMYYHLNTSGYGAFVEDEAVGWMFVRGQHQVLTLDALVVAPAWRRHGVGRTLLEYAEKQGREQKRHWLGMRILSTNENAWGFLTACGMRPASSGKVFRGQVPPRANHGDAALKLHQLDSRSGQETRQRFIELELSDVAGHEPGAYLAQYVLEGVPGRPIREWLVEYNGEQAGYLGLYEQFLCLACAAEWRGRLPVIHAIQAALSAVSGLERIDLHAGSAEHHDALRAMLAKAGLDEVPAYGMTMIKRLLPG